MAVELPDDFMVANPRVQVGNSGPEPQRNPTVMDRIEVPIQRGGAIPKRNPAIAQDVEAPLEQWSRIADSILPGAREGERYRSGGGVTSIGIDEETGWPRREVGSERVSCLSPVARA